LTANGIGLEFQITWKVAAAKGTQAGSQNTPRSSAQPNLRTENAAQAGGIPVIIRPTFAGSSRHNRARTGGASVMYQDTATTISNPVEQPPWRELTKAIAAQAVSGSSKPTETELLATARAALDAGEQASTPHFRQAAEALAKSYKLYKTTQKKMGEAIGRSQPWVSSLISWHVAGYPTASPFGPTSNAERRYQRANIRCLQDGYARPGRSAAAFERFKLEARHWLSKMDDEAVAEAKAFIAAWERRS
jgi:hypothetical protein